MGGGENGGNSDPYVRLCCFEVQAYIFYRDVVHQLFMHGRSCESWQHTLESQILLKNGFRINHKQQHHTSLVI